MARVIANSAGYHVDETPARAPEASQQGTPLVLLHGFTGSTATWQPHRESLARQRRVVAVDLLGHGRSDAPPEPSRYAMPRAVADVVALLDALGIERASLLGYSMGARLALHAAAAAPERIVTLVLESGSPGLRGDAERAARRESDEALARRIERDGVEAFVDYWEALPLFASQRMLPPDVRLALRRQRLANMATGLANSLRGMGTGAQEPLWERLGEIAVPTTIVTGECDRKFVEIGRLMAAAMPAARLETVRGAGHAVHLEQPAIFIEAVSRRLIADS